MLCSVWTFECTLLKSTSPGILQERRKEHHCKQLQMFWRGWRKSRNLGSIPRVREIYFLVDFISKRTLGNPFWNPFLHRFLVDWNITFRAVLINILIVVMGDVTSTKYLVTGWGRDTGITGKVIILPLLTWLSLQLYCRNTRRRN